MVRVYLLSRDTSMFMLMFFYRAQNGLIGSVELSG